ncbi:acyl-CoA dehydrogenase family protein [Amycolatopsis sp. DSM 110486]|uniref:acyl-CoA dehydrogenase family protein n=1 Tax=Amycolatopsis sp. DSM 110486 TaxID=2865832 RepID=UPI001C6A38C8|nr:acyl-CoA dehydrogenase family protein [Amycolatopsis sp. DSM 110486]QYN17915.1 hydroxylase [Amycolatopsis sp. DSM 110486]
MGTRDDLLDKAQPVAAAAAEHAGETERRRALAPEVVSAARASGLFRAGLPASLGGSEPSAAAILRAAERVAEADASAGWCVSIAATSSLLGAYLPEKGGQEVFGDPDAVAAGVWAPRGKAVAVDGGVTVSGRWSFCSGVTHADWIFLGVVLDGKLVVAAIPTAELEIHDTWHTSGLRGTGSHDTSADTVFVPDHRLLSVVDGPPAGAGQLHRFPLFGFFAASISAAALGNARGAITEFVELAAAKHPSGSRRSLAERTATQSAVAEAEASLRAAREFYYRAIDDAWQAALSDSVVPDDLRLALRLACTHAVRISADVARSLYDLGGGSAIYETSPLQRRFRDAHTATAHFQVNPATFELTGRLLLGLPTETAQL